MPPLDRIRIAGFKSIRDRSLELRPLNVLIGANGAGKSNFIEVFRFLHEIVEQNLQLYVGRSGGADRLLHFGSKETQRVVFELRFGLNGYEVALTSAAGDALVFEREDMWFQRPDYESPYHESLGAGHKESGLMPLIQSSDRKRVAHHVRDAIRSWRVYHFHDTSASARVKQTVDLGDNAVLRSDAGNLAAFLYRLEHTHPGVFRNIEDTVTLMAPFFGGFELRPDRLNPDKIKLEWREKSVDAYFDAHALSDGTLRFLCLATLLLQPEPPTTILIDEPELGLHPYAITILADLFRSAAQRTQLVVSTQSVTLVNQLSPEDIVVVDREDHASVFRRPTSEELEGWLEGYALGDLWEKNLLGGRPTS